MRSNFFYPRMAAANLGKNRVIYQPYLLAGGLIVALFYILSSIAILVGESGMEGGWQMATILQMSSWVCGMISLLVLFYLNSFVMKRRRKEFGLYSILGMEKRHIARVMGWEVLFTGSFCILAGIVGGAIFSQLMFLLLLRITGLPVSLDLRIPLNSVRDTVLLYLAGFVVVLLYDLVIVVRSSPMQLLQSSREGEREPRTRWVAASSGMAALLGGYGVAWWVSTPTGALLAFFPAVMLVIIGTYFLFVAGSILLLKGLRRNKNFYYRPENFIAVSGMIYRMKQNAAGLANICILSTCVLVTLSSTVCLFVGEEDILRERFPRQVHVNCILQEGTEPQTLPVAAMEHARQYGFTVERPVAYANFAFPSIRTARGFDRVKAYSSETWQVLCLTGEDYDRLTGEHHPLAEGEALLYLSSGAVEGGSIVLAGMPYRVTGAIPMPELPDLSDTTTAYAVAVLPNLEDLQILSKTEPREQTAAEQTGVDQGYIVNDEPIRPVWYDYWFDLEGDDARLGEFYGTLRETMLETAPRIGIVDNIDAARSDFLRVFGSLLFVGLFFIALFLTATVLILYYKQISEGFDDHERFRIMQQVGMGDEEVRRTIRQQVRLVFFLPIGMAVVHIAAAFRVLCLLLSAFAMTNTRLFALCTLVSVLVFIVFYAIVYRLTARSYYRLVQADGPLTH